MIFEKFIDKDCSDVGTPLQSSLSKIKDIDLSQYDKVFFSCNYGYKSSEILSLLNKNYLNLFYLSK